MKRDWSDHALWWEQRCQWLLRPGRTLDALGVGADARLRFAPQHRPLRLRLPNRRRLRLRLSFAQPVCSVVAEACRLLGRGGSWGGWEVILGAGGGLGGRFGGLGRLRG